MKVQINHWEPHRYRFCSYEDAKVIEVDEFIEIGTGRSESGCRYGVYIRDLDNGILSMLGGQIQVTGFREEVPEGAFFSGIFKREMWIKVPDDTEVTEK